MIPKFRVWYKMYQRMSSRSIFREGVRWYIHRRNASRILEGIAKRICVDWR